jgi:hypothetical protein
MIPLFPFFNVPTKTKLHAAVVSSTTFKKQTIPAPEGSSQRDEMCND